MTNSESPAAAVPSREAQTDDPAMRSAAEFARRFAARQPHSEAVADCAHCTLAFLAGRVLDALGPEPIKPKPPGPPDPPRRADAKPTPHPSSGPSREALDAEVERLTQERDAAAAALAQLRGQIQVLDAEIANGQACRSEAEFTRWMHSSQETRGNVAQALAALLPEPTR